MHVVLLGSNNNEHKNTLQNIKYYRNIMLLDIFVQYVSGSSHRYVGIFFKASEYPTVSVPHPIRCECWLLMASLPAPVSENLPSGWIRKPSLGSLDTVLPACIQWPMGKREQNTGSPCFKVRRWDEMHMWTHHLHAVPSASLFCFFHSFYPKIRPCM